MIQGTTATFQTVASLNLQVTDPKSHNQTGHKSLGLNALFICELSLAHGNEQHQFGKALLAHMQRQRKKPALWQRNTRRGFKNLTSSRYGAERLCFGAAAAGVGSAIFQAHHDAVLGAALAGGIIGGARALFPTTTCKNIYVQGAAAVDCAVIATSLGTPAPSDADNLHSSLIARQLANADSNVASLRTNLETIRPRLSFSSGFAQAGGLARLQAEALLSTLETPQIKLDEANAALIQVEATNPQTLYRVLHVIARAVDSQLTNNSVNVDSALKAFNGVIDAAQKKLADALKAAKETNNNAKENAKQAVGSNR